MKKIKVKILRNYEWQIESELLLNERKVYVLKDESLGQKLFSYIIIVTNFIQLVSLQLVDQFSQTKLHQKAPNKGYLYIYRMYKSNNKQLRYQAISNY